VGKAKRAHPFKFRSADRWWHGAKGAFAHLRSLFTPRGFAKNSSTALRSMPDWFVEFAGVRQHFGSALRGGLLEEITPISGVTRQPATGKAASEVLSNARELDNHPACCAARWMNFWRRSARRKQRS